MDTVTVGINVFILQEEDQFIAYCPALELSSYGYSIDQTRERFDKELEIFFEETSKKGTLEKYLLKLGWTLLFKSNLFTGPGLNVRGFVILTSSMLIYGISRQMSAYSIK